MVFKHRPRFGAVALTLVIAALASLVVIAMFSSATNANLLAPPATPAMSPTPLLTATNQLTLDLGGTGIPSHMQVGTNIQGAAELIPASSQPAKTVLSTLQSWNQPLVRLHFGFRSEDVITLPEAQQGSWDFTRLDTVIATLRTHHIAFFLDVRTAPTWMYDSVGQLPDSNFPAFATYMARLVGWYNQGGFTDDNGVRHISGHTNWIHIWEIWNEPKSAQDIPVAVPDRNMSVWMQAPRYAHLYDLTTTAMRAVDPTIMTGGPALGSWPDQNNYWIQTFMTNEHMPIDFLSFHFYAALYPPEPDAPLFAAVRGDRFADRLIANRTMLDQLRPGQHIPIWITELNIDENSEPPTDVRGTAPIEYAFLADAFITAAQHGVGLIDQFNMVSNNQYGLIDDQSFQTFRPAWYYQLFSREFPADATFLPMPEDVAHGVVALAAIAPDGHSLRLLIGNIQVAHPLDVNGQGVPKVIQIVLSGSYQGQSITPHTAAKIWRFDVSTAQGMPAAQTAAVFTTSSGQPAIQVALTGYGSSMIDIPLGAK